MGYNTAREQSSIISVEATALGIGTGCECSRPRSPRRYVATMTRAGCGVVLPAGQQLFTNSGEKNNTNSPVMRGCTCTM